MAIDIAYARRGDVNVAYTTIGRGPTDLIFGVGLVAHIDLLCGDPYASAWLQRLASSHRVILFDKPGTGLSDPVTGEPTVAERVEDFVAVLDAAGSTRAVVVALSEAGPPAALLAATRPDRVQALVLLSTLARTTCAPDYLPELEEHFETAIWGPLWHGAEHWGDGTVLRAISPLFRHHPVYRRLAPAVERASASPGMARRIIRSVRRYDVREVLPAIGLPTLVVGREREWSPASAQRDLAARIPGAELTLLPGDEHLPWVDGDDVADVVLDFLHASPASTAAADRALVTLLYTDIVGSTTAAAGMGDQRWRWVVTRHDDITREEVDRHGGRLVKTLGDGALSTFERPLLAVRCAVAVRDRLRDLDVQLRAAVHTGECELRGDDVTGIAAHLASRLLAHAEPGEVVTSSTVRDLTLGSGLDLAPRDTVELRGVPGRWDVLVVRSLHRNELRSEAIGPPDRWSSAAGASMTPAARRLVKATQRTPRLTRRLLTGSRQPRGSHRPVRASDDT